MLTLAVLIFQVFLSQFGNGELKLVTTEFSHTKEHSDFYQRLHDSIFYEGSPHVTYPNSTADAIQLGEAYVNNTASMEVKYTQKSTKYSVINVSVPIIFDNTEYYWSKEAMNTNVFKICKYHVTTGDYSLDKTTLKDETGAILDVESIFYQCGIGGTCVGLHCQPPDFWFYGASVAGALSVILMAISLVLVIRRIRKKKRETRESAMREAEERRTREETEM